MTMEHACSRIQSYVSKQLLLEAPDMLNTIEERYVQVPFGLSLAVQICTAWQPLYGETYRS